jgi:hypothetical protein
MMSSRRAGVSIAVVAALAVALSGCASSGVTTSSIATSETITPIQNSAVASSDLTVLPGSTVQQASLPAAGAPGEIGQPAQVANADGSLATLGAVPSAPGRDLSTGPTIEKLLGGWTVVSGAEQCKLNLTQTAKSGTSRYRASTPGCALPGLKVVASWQLVGNQVQLFDEAGDIIASLILSGNQFIGTLAGGQGITMVG